MAAPHNRLLDRCQGSSWTRSSVLVFVPGSDHKELARLREVVDISRHESQQRVSAQDVQAELLAIKDSKSWRVTAPLRRLMRQFRI